MKNFNLLILLVTGLLLFIAVSFYFVWSKDVERADKKEKEVEPVGWCGNAVHTFYYRGGHGSEYYQKGKSLFKAYCAMCHHKNMKDPLTGPGLGGAIGRWRNDTIRLHSYLINPKEYFLKESDSRMKALHKEYGNGGKAGLESLSLEDVKRIVDYIELVR